MSVQLIQLSVVVTANFHNPSILHPAFLASEAIVPPDWEPAEGEFFSTPAASAVKYKNGIAFQVEPKKLQVTEWVTETRSSGWPESSLVPELAVLHVRVLPKVPYAAVGINPQGFQERATPTEYLLNRFARPEPLELLPERPRGLMMRFSYTVAGTRLRLEFAAGRVDINGRAREGIIIGGNYHIQARSADAVIAGVSRFNELCSDFVKVTEALLQ